MRAVFNRPKLAEAFSRAALFVPTRSRVDILRHVKLVARGGSVELMATDMEGSIRTAVESATIESEGEILLPADRLGAFLRECGGDEVVIESKKLEIAVKSERGLLRLGIVAPDEFPVIQEFNADKAYQVKACSLKRAIACAGGAAGEGNSDIARQYVLNSVYFEVIDGRLTLVSTDGSILSSATIPLVGQADDQTALLLPHLAKQLGRALPDSLELVSLATSENNLSAQVGGTVIHCRQSEGRYPQWRKALPTRPREVRLSINAGYLRSGVRQASIVHSDQSAGIIVEFNRDCLRLQMAEAERGESTVDIPVSYSGPQVKARLSFRYLDSALRTIADSDLVTLDAQDRDSPVVIEADDGMTNHVVQVQRWSDK